MAVIAEAPPDNQQFYWPEWRCPMGMFPGWWHRKSWFEVNPDEIGTHF
jgi:hypothetical protein